MGKLNDNFLRRNANLLQKASNPPPITNSMVKGVSAERRSMLEAEVERGLFSDGTGNSNSGLTPMSFATSSVGIKKQAQIITANTSSQWRGGNGEALRQTPEVYSPLWLNSNLNLPRDRATINAWCRSFYALEPFVQNAINLHSTYPISKLNIKCPNKKIEKFFNDMIEEIDLMNICVSVAQEFWLLGEAFIYAELDERAAKWSRLVIQNPDYVVVKRSVIASEPLIMLRPDENLRRIVFSNKPSDIEQKRQLNSTIVEHIKRGENIPLDNFYVSHLARRISPYEVRGTGLPVCCFRQLMLFDKLRECYDEETELLTNQGFKSISDLVHLSSEIKTAANNIKANTEIATVDPKTSIVEYKAPTKLDIKNYNGKMYHLIGKKVDCLVLPEHKVYASENINKKWQSYESKPISELLINKKSYKLNSKVKFNTSYNPKTFNVAGVNVPAKLYLKVLGYLVSEGCIYSNFEKGRYDAFIYVNQNTSSDCYDDMRESFDLFAKLFNKNSNNYVSMRAAGFSENKPKEMWETAIHGKNIMRHFKEEIGTNGNTISHFKKLPRWAMELVPELSTILLNALVKGDGTEGISKYGTGSKNFKYSTVSKQLADDVYELVYKLGFVPNICISTKNLDDRTVIEYIVMWSDTIYGDMPRISSMTKVGNNGGGARINETNYNGKLWSLNTSSELIVIRRNGKVSIQNCNEYYDFDTEILTKDGFKKIGDISYQVYDNYVNGIELNENGEISSILTMKEDFTAACFNPITNRIEYHKPLELHMSQYEGEMVSFKSRNVDILVTPNHKMFAQKKNRKNGKNGWNNWEKIKAFEINPNTTYRFRGIANWDGKTIDTVKVLDKDIPADIYMKFLGYVISEGYLGHNHIDLLQKVDSDCIDDIQTATRLFAGLFDKETYEREVATKDYKKSGFKKQPSNRWNARINSKALTDYFKNEIADDPKYTTAVFKKIPAWVKELDINLLSILLESLVSGDGSNLTNKKSLAYKYYTSSKQLADDVQEIAFKCGFAPSLHIHKLREGRLPEYIVSWSDATDGNFPLIMPNKHYPPKITKENYKGVVWCLETTTGLFVTRRKGKITIQGNSKFAQSDNMVNPLTLVKIGSADYKPTFADLEAWRNVFEEAQYDKDFKIFTHEGVTVERVGYNQGIFDISGDITQLLKETYMGLMVPQVLMDGGGDITYANGGISLDVLRQRYMQFRNMMSTWLRKKIFAPISKLNEFYEYEDGEKKLILPEVDWNHMSLFDTSDFVNVLVQLSGEQKKVSQQTLYRSLGLEYEEERRKIKKEDIGDAIRKKELASLDRMALNELRALSEEDEIPEITEAPLLGQSPYSDQTQQGAEQPGGPGGGLPPLPGLPPPPGGLGGPSIPPGPPPPPGGPAGPGSPAGAPQPPPTS
jgi:hypothetical protein